MARPAPARTAISPAPKSQLVRVIVPDAKLRAIFENFNRDDERNNISRNLQDLHVVSSNETGCEGNE